MNVKEVEASSIDSLINKESVVLLDIREEYEYEDFHLKSLHIPMAEVMSRLDELLDYPEIVVCCRSGNRAQAIAYHLQKEFTEKDVSYLKGGLVAYMESHA